MLEEKLFELSVNIAFNDEYNIQTWASFSFHHAFFFLYALKHSFTNHNTIKKEFFIL